MKSRCTMACLGALRSASAACLATFLRALAFLMPSLTAAPCRVQTLLELLAERRLDGRAVPRAPLLPDAVRAHGPAPLLPPSPTHPRGART